jgi:hypothetical protein
MPAKTQRERADAAREEKLKLMREQIKEGSLVVRQMTPRERARHKPRPQSPRRRGGR